MPALQIHQIFPLTPLHNKYVARPVYVAVKRFHGHIMAEAFVITKIYDKGMNATIRVGDVNVSPPDQDFRVVGQDNASEWWLVASVRHEGRDLGNLRYWMV